MKCLLLNILKSCATDVQYASNEKKGISSWWKLELSCFRMTIIDSQCNILMMHRHGQHLLVNGIISYVMQCWNENCQVVSNELFLNEGFLSVLVYERLSLRSMGGSWLSALALNGWLLPCSIIWCFYFSHVSLAERSRKKKREKELQHY